MPFYKGAEVFTSTNHKFSSLSKAHTQPFIYRAHKELRDINKKAYEPQIIAIGPYHRGKDSLKMMEEYKLRYFQLLLEHRKENIERYISIIGPLEQRARNCYAEPISLSAVEFVEMLILDGCFIIELVRQYKNNSSRENDPIFQMEWILPALHRDLILFENQVPFFVLCELFDLIVAPNKHNKLIDLLIFFNRNYYKQLFSERSPSSSSENIKHILHLMHDNLRPDPDSYCLDIDGNSANEIELRFIHSATELRDANVEFRKRESCDNLFEVKFENGIMEMPILAMMDDTECIFRNFIVFEQYFPKYGSSIITDYAIFLDCLINSPKDVEILSQCGIIHNCLGDSKMVADIFNQLGHSVIGPGHYYAEILGKVNAHYKKGWNRSMAILKRDVFNSIWAYISFFVAFALILLTIVQSVSSILQVV